MTPGSIACLMLAGAPLLAQGLEGNHLFVEKAMRQIAGQAVSPLDSLRRVPVAVAHRPLEQNSAERLLYQKLIECLRAREFRTVAAATDSSADAVRIDFKIVAFDLTYHKLPAGWFRSGKMRRAVKTLVDFDIRSAGGEVHFQGMLSAARADTLPAKLAGQIETPELPLTRGRWEEDGNGKSMWEPLLLAAATGAVVYAFYSLRSQ